MTPITVEVVPITRMRDPIDLVTAGRTAVGTADPIEVVLVRIIPMEVDRVHTLPTVDRIAVVPGPILEVGRAVTLPIAAVDPAATHRIAGQEVPEMMIEVDPGRGHQIAEARLQLLEGGRVLELQIVEAGHQLLEVSHVREHRIAEAGLRLLMIEAHRVLARQTAEARLQRMMQASIHQEVSIARVLLPNLLPHKLTPPQRLLKATKARKKVLKPRARLLRMPHHLP